MTDQEIYKELGLIIYNESPNIENNLHILCRVVDVRVGTTIWWGNKKSGSFGLSPKSQARLVELIRKLKQFYIDNNFGEWNIFHYILDVNNSSFSIDFENSEEIANGEPFWKFSRKFFEG